MYQAIAWYHLEPTSRPNRLKWSSWSPLVRPLTPIGEDKEELIASGTVVANSRISFFDTYWEGYIDLRLPKWLQMIVHAVGGTWCFNTAKTKQLLNTALVQLSNLRCFNMSANTKWLTSESGFLMVSEEPIAHWKCLLLDTWQSWPAFPEASFPCLNALVFELWWPKFFDAGNNVFQSLCESWYELRHLLTRRLNMSLL